MPAVLEVSSVAPSLPVVPRTRPMRLVSALLLALGVWNSCAAWTGAAAAAAAVAVAATTNGTAPHGLPREVAELLQNSSSGKMVPVPTKAKDLKYLSMVLSNVQAEADRALKDKVETGKLASEEADRALKRDSLALKRDALALKDKVETGKLAGEKANCRNALVIGIATKVSIVAGAFLSLKLDTLSALPARSARLAHSPLSARPACMR